jgi:dihydroflavonol-4-reductase
VARFIAALDDVLHDVYGGIRLLGEVGWTMGSVGRRSGERTTRPRLADLNPSFRTEFVVMPADRVLGAGDRVVVTGATGFVGSAVVRALQARGADVVAMVEPGADDRNLRDLDAHRLTVDIRDAEGVRAAVTGARFVFHLAAVYRFWARDRQVFREVNVGGTIHILDAVRAEGIERLVYTSTVGVLGLNGTDRGMPANEGSYADLGHLFGDYKRTKYVAEHEVLRAAAQGLDVSLVLPTFPLGPGDLAPTPTGKLVLDFLNGRVPAFVDTAMNVVHVDDVALGHVAALERGMPGRSYILGGENLSMRDLLAELAGCTGLPMPRLRIPRTLAVSIGLASQIVQAGLLRRQPAVPLEAARTSTRPMIFDDQRARAELGHASRPARAAIEDSAHWFVDGGYVSAGRRAAIRWRG